MSKSVNICVMRCETATKKVRKIDVTTTAAAPILIHDMSTAAITLIVIGYRYMQVQSFQKSASLRLSMTYVYAVMPVCAAIMAWYALVDMVELLVNGEMPPSQEASL